jgi:DNA-binding transcriptional MerR regulator
MTQRQSQVNLLNIHQFAEVCRTTPRTIRFYDQKGLIKPFKVDRWNGYRYYQAEQARDFFKIQLIQSFHLTLEQVKNIKRKRELDTPLKQRLAGVKKEIAEKQKEYKFLDEVEEFMFSNRHPKRELKLKSFGPYILFGTYTQNIRYDQINGVIYELKALAKRLKIPVKDQQMDFYFDQGYHPSGTRLEIFLICKEKINSKKYQLPPGYFFKNYPKTKCLYYNYIGPYKYLTFIHKKFAEYLEPKNVLKGLVFDLYKAGPWNKKSEYDHQTILGFPISEDY